MKMLARVALAGFSGVLLWRVLGLLFVVLSQKFSHNPEPIGADGEIEKWSPLRTSLSFESSAAIPTMAKASRYGSCRALRPLGVPAR